MLHATIDAHKEAISQASIFGMHKEAAAMVSNLLTNNKIFQPLLESQSHVVAFVDKAKVAVTECGGYLQSARHCSSCAAATVVH